MTLLERGRRLLVAVTCAACVWAERAEAGPPCVDDAARVTAALHTLIAATNDGRFRAIDSAITTLTDPARLTSDRRATFASTIGTWHWQSGAFTSIRTCALTHATGYALLQNQLTGEVDSLQVAADSVSGRLRGLALRAGAHVAIASHDTSSDAARVAALRRLARHLADARVFAGEVLLARDGRVLYHEALGISNRETGTPARIGDAYSIASVGKLFTGVAVMQLVERGKIRLDDSLGAFLPDSARPRDAGAVPIKTILSHTDGMVRGSDTLAFKPGTRFSYVNYGYYLLGRVIEQVTGMPFADYYQSELFASAGMRATRRLVLSQPDPVLPPGYEFRFDSSGAHLERNTELQTIPATGAGGMFSTADDLFRFAEALRTGKLVSLPTLREMRTPRTELGASDYGYGIDRNRGQNIWGHSGFIPGANTDVELYGDSGYVLVVMSNTGMNEPIRRKAAALIGERPFAAGGTSNLPTR